MSDGEMITVAVGTALLVVATVAAWLSWSSVAMLRRQITADLLLRLDERLDDFHDIHVRLRPGGDWQPGGQQPAPADWPKIDAYLGFFQRIDLMVDRGLLSIREVDDFYGYRYDNIVRNATIRDAKLKGPERHYWGRFIDLGVKLDRHRAQKRAPGRDQNATAR